MSHHDALRRALPRTTGLLAVVLVVLGVVSGCGGDSGSSTAEKSPKQVMATAKKTFDEASSVHINLATTSMPTNGNAVLGATGDITQAPAFQGDVKVVLSGLTATVPITSVDGKVYAKLPLQTKYAVIRPSEYGAPDPAAFADPSSGLSSLLTQITGLKKTGQKRSGDTILTSYSGTLPGSAVKKIIPSAAASSSYATVVGVDKQGQAQTVKITGRFFSGNDKTTYDVAFSQYDKGVTISAPPS